MHNTFTLFFRKVPSGKNVVYYYAYDEKIRGKRGRLGPWSTGLEKKTAARNYCIALFREGKLLPAVEKSPIFEQWAALFWDWENSPYLREQRKRRDLTRHYADKNLKVAMNNLTPYFGKMRLNEITSDVIDGWLDKMIADGYKNTTTNSYFGTLQTMLKWAAKKSMIEKDPFILVKKLIDDRRERQIITQDEFKALFADDWETVWNNDLLRCTANKIAALTGLRCCEILGLKGEFVFDTHIYLNAQHDKYGYRGTKTKVKHNIPLTSSVIRDLEELKAVNGNGYVFSLTGGETPVSREHIFNGLTKALNNIGISNEEMKRRGINIHAWRHFCNTELLKGGLDVSKVQKVTGHKTLSSTERYSHLDPLEFGDVPRIQEELLKPSRKGKETEQGIPALTLVKMPEQEKDMESIKVS